MFTTDEAKIKYYHLNLMCSYNKIHVGQDTHVNHLKNAKIIPRLKKQNKKKAYIWLRRMTITKSTWDTQVCGGFKCFIPSAKIIFEIT